jgi:hypothetical protein
MPGLDYLATLEFVWISVAYKAAKGGEVLVPRFGLIILFDEGYRQFLLR